MTINSPLYPFQDLTMEVKHITIEGLRLSYEVGGSGTQAVIVMHGWGCRASTVRILSEAAITAGTTVYSLDMPGFGESEEPHEIWGVEQYADFVENFCKALNISQPILIGHSFGGRVAIVLAARLPIAKLILVDAAGIKPRRSLKYYIKVYTFKAAKKILPLLIGQKRAGGVIERMRGKSGSSDYAAASPQMRGIMSRVVNEDLRHLLPSIKASTLLIWGERDTATPISDAQLMERLIPDAGLVSYPEAGHYSFIDRPAQTTAVIKSFINA